VLAVELPVHQYVLDVNQFLGRIQEVLEDFYAGLSLPNWPRIKDDWDGVAN